MSSKQSKKQPAAAPAKRSGAPWVLWVVAGVLAVGVLYLVTKPAGPKPGDVGNAQFAELIARPSGEVRIVDVRTPGEYASGHIPGAENVPVDTVPQAAAGWSKTQPIALYCATGSRSLNAMQYLRAQGFTQVYNLTAGIGAWDGETVAGTDVGGKPAVVDTGGKPVVLEFSGST